MSTTHPIHRTQIQHYLEISTDLKLVEALPKRYFDEAHLPRAINIPLDQVRELAPQQLPDKDQLIVVYCANTECLNSGKAAKILAEMGYTQVFEYVEGKQDWIDHKLPVERAASTQAA